MRLRVASGCWTLVAVMTVCCVITGRVAADDPFAGAKAGQELTQRPWLGTYCWCPPGQFRMGERVDVRSNARQVDVTLTRGFWMGKYEVTQAQYQFVMGKNPSKFKGVFRPVEMVSWNDATEFCRKLTKLARKAGRLPAGWEYRLPTEAQWEYACRAGTTTRYPFGNDSSKLDDYAWTGRNSGTKEGIQKLNQLAREELSELSVDDALAIAGKKTHPVGQKKPNRWGLCDMYGNVGEWCRDWYRPELPGGTDPEVIKTATTRVGRGTSWCGDSMPLRSVSRQGIGRPDNRSNTRGFRVAIVRTGKQGRK